MLHLAQTTPSNLLGRSSGPLSMIIAVKSSSPSMSTMPSDCLGCLRLTKQSALSNGIAEVHRTQLWPTGL